MMLEVSLDTLNRSKITAHQFLICRLILDKKFDKLKTYLETTQSTESLLSDLTYLELNNFIKLNNYDVSKDLTNLNVTSEFTKTIANGSLFEELYDIYPIKVMRDSGVYDYLRAERYNSARLYDMIVGRNQSKHEHILACLKFEIEWRERTGNMRFMKRLYKWLADAGWKSFEEMVGDHASANSNFMPYGTDLE